MESEYKVAITFFIGLCVFVVSLMITTTYNDVSLQKHCIELLKNTNANIEINKKVIEKMCKL